MPSSDYIKTPPYSDEAEKSVLGCMMLDKDCVLTAVNMLSEDDFYVERNKWIFVAISEIMNRGYAVDYVTIIDKLSVEGVMDKVGADYIAELQEIVTSTKNIEQYCRIVSEKAALRNMIINFGDIINKCYKNEEELSDIIDDAQKYIYDLSVDRARSEFISLREAMTPAIIKLSELYKAGEDLTGVASGFKGLDRVTGGLQKSDLILIAARPSMGKTALGLNIAQNAAIRGKKTVAFFSLEMSCEQLLMRIISSETQVNSMSIRLGKQSQAQWKKITVFNGAIAESDTQLYIDDTSGISAGDMRAKLRKLKSTKGLDLVIIDYLQLMSTKSRNENRQQEISSISRELKALAKELNCPLIALSQLSRSPEGRGDKRPILSDLRESGAIEQDADIVMMLYRDNYYNKESEDENTELIINKHRNGETGTVFLKFLEEYTKFIDAPPKRKDEE